MAKTILLMAVSLARLRHDIEQRRLAFFDPLDAALERRGQVLGIGDRSLAIQAVGFRHLGVVDIGLPQLGPDMAAVLSAIARAGAALQDYHLGMIAAVVVHDGEQWNLVMGGSPQNGGSVIEIAIALDVDRQAAVLLVGQRRAHGGRSIVADAAGTLTADVLVRAVEIS